MALTNATRLADFGSGISGVIQVDNINERKWIQWYNYPWFKSYHIHTTEESIKIYR